jgi:formate/nitrite transporter
MIILLGLELLTGCFAVVPMAVMAGKAKIGQMITNWSWVFIGNLIGSVLYGVMFAVAFTNAWHNAPSGVADRVRALAEAKTIGYAAIGTAGMVTVFVKAMLCNWMVCMGVVMGLCSTSTVGRIVAAWMPILVFFAQGFEHTVVNMFIIPTGMMLGAKVTLADWFIWNLVPVTLGNLVGGFVFVGLALFLTFGPKLQEAGVPAPMPAE